jgi:plastocyanin
MRFGIVLSVLVMIAAALPTRDAAAFSRRKECRLACVAAIDDCVAAGGKPRRCKRQILKRCRHDGTSACAPPSTTTTTSEETTTSVPGGSTSTSPGATSTTSLEVTTTSEPVGTTTTLPSPMNGCTYIEALDRSAPGALRTIVFDYYYYSPPCIRIAAGQTATFQGSFVTHPLVGGTIVDMTKMPDATSPIPFTSSGTSKDVSFPAAGTFPYYCDAHGADFGMYGVVYVDP